MHNLCQFKSIYVFIKQIVFPSLQFIIHYYHIIASVIYYFNYHLVVSVNCYNHTLSILLFINYYHSLNALVNYLYPSFSLYQLSVIALYWQYIILTIIALYQLCILSLSFYSLLYQFCIIIITLLVL